MKRKRFTEEQIITVLREHEAGAKPPDKSRVINYHTIKLSIRSRAQWAELEVAGEGDDER